MFAADATGRADPLSPQPWPDGKDQAQRDPAGYPLALRTNHESRREDDAASKNSAEPGGVDRLISKEQKMT